MAFIPYTAVCAAFPGITPVKQHSDKQYGWICELNGKALCWLIVMAAMYISAPVMTRAASGQPDDSLVELTRMIDDGAYKQAEDFSDKLRQKIPADPRLKFIDARLLAETGRKTQAEKIYRELIREYPDQPEPYNNLAVLYAGDGQFLKAKDLLEKAVQSSPAYASAHRNLQQIYMQIASDAYREALEPDDDAAVSRTKLVFVDNLNLPEATAVSLANTAATTTVTGGIVMQSTSAVPGNAAPDSKQIIQLVDDWARAWSEQDVKAYLAVYDSEFVPDPPLTYKDWVRQRRVRLKNPQFIHVTINEPEVLTLANDVVSVTFIQDYQSDLVKDTIRKQLLMKRRSDGWRILQENLIR